MASREFKVTLSKISVLAESGAPSEAMHPHPSGIRDGVKHMHRGEGAGEREHREPENASARVTGLSSE